MSPEDEMESRERAESWRLSLESDSQDHTGCGAQFSCYLQTLRFSNTDVTTDLDFLNHLGQHFSQHLQTLCLIRGRYLGIITYLWREAYICDRHCCPDCPSGSNNQNNRLLSPLTTLNRRFEYLEHNRATLEI